MNEMDEAKLIELLESSEEQDLAGDESGALAEARRGLELARAAGDVPDPGPVFWRRFEARVAESLPPRRRKLPGPIWLAAAAAIVALSVSLPRAPGPHMASEWRALPAEDAGWQVLEGLGEAMVALEPEAACAVEECLLDLSDGESRRLATLLREAMKRRES